MKALQIWYVSLNMPTLQMLFYKIFQESSERIFLNLEYFVKKPQILKFQQPLGWKIL